MVINNTLLNMVIIIAIVGIASIPLLAMYDYNTAEETCSELRSEEDCFYEICMAEEYKSSEQQDKVDSCMLEVIYKNDVPKQEGVKE